MEKKIENAHQQSQIYSFLLQNDKIYSVSQTKLKIWDTTTLNLIQQKNINSHYLISICKFKQYILIGLQDGKIQFLDQQLNTFKVIHFHQDLITDILETDLYIISSSIDGQVIFMDKHSFQKIKSVQLNRPIWKLKCFLDQIYGTGNPAVKINLINFQTQDFEVSRCFQVYKNQIYSCNYNSITNINKNVKSYISCDLLIEFNGVLYGLKQQMIGKLFNVQEGFMHWKWIRLQYLHNGYELRVGVVKDNMLYLGGDKSQILIISEQKLNLLFKQ